MKTMHTLLKNAFNTTLFFNRYISVMSKFIVTLMFSSFIIACTQTPERPSPNSTQALSNEKISISSSEREEYKRGLIALHNNEDDDAEKIFNNFIKNNSKLAGAYTNLALLHFKKKEYKHSLKLVNQALLKNPKQAQAYQLRAQIFVNIGKIHDAKKDYIQAIKLKPDYINAQYNLALLYDIYLQEIALAIKHYEIYLSLIKKPDDTTKEWVNHLKETLANG